MEHEVPHRVHAEQPHEIVRVNDVALGFGHLAVPLQQPGMAEYLLGQRLAQRHQENGPVNGMEADDVLADKVQVGRPVFFIIFAAVPVGIVAEAGDIVGQGVQPDIDDVLFVKRHGNPPRKRSAGNAEILQSFQQEIIHHLVFTGNGLNEFRMSVDVLDQPIGIFPHSEEISLLFGGFHFPAAVGTLPVHQLAFRPEGLAGGAVHPLITAFINIPLVVKFLKDFRDRLLVFRVGGADEFVIRSAHQVPDLPDFPRDFIHILLGRHPRLFRFFLDLLAVLVRARLEKYVVAFLALEPCNRVRQNRFISVPDMRFSRRICNRRRDIIRFFRLIVHSPLPLLSVPFRELRFVFHYTPFPRKSKSLFALFAPLSSLPAPVRPPIFCVFCRYK